MNPLYDQMKNSQPANGFVQRFQQFRQSFQGNPKDQVQQLLNSGRVSQADYNRAVQLAQQMQKLIGQK